MSNLTFPPTPNEDRTHGRNSNVYLKANGDHPTKEEVQRFINEIKEYAIAGSKETGIPASVVIAMGILECGSGFTRIAQYANNLFAIKEWDGNPSNAWQLQGQPDEGEAKVVERIENNPDRVIYDENSRPDNWYRKFNSRKESVQHLMNTFLQTDRYRPARDNYQNRITTQQMSLSEAAKQYAFDLGEAGYNHKGGAYYRDMVTKVMDKWNLYAFDSQDAQVQPVSGLATDQATVQEAASFLKEGSKGDQVRELQENLHHLGIDAGPTDGNFGPQTKNAVMQFQSEHQLKVDGIVGPNTLNRLQEEISQLSLAGKF